MLEQQSFLASYKHDALVYVPSLSTNTTVQLMLLGLQAIGTPHSM